MYEIVFKIDLRFAIFVISHIFNYNYSTLLRYFNIDIYLLLIKWMRFVIVT